LVQIPDWQVSPAAQSALVLHAVRQALAPQMYGAQLAVVFWQAPAPSQLPPLVAVPAVQEGEPQLVPAAAERQAPAPLQVPSNPQGGAAAQPPCGSLVPAATAEQVPADPATLQAAQVPQLAVPQQTPSTQLPPWHSLPAAQDWPRRLSPHEPALQTFPGAQSPSLPQTATQAEPLQANGAQLWVLADWQTPAPLQVRASVAVVVPVGQVDAAHWVPAAYSWQAPLPSQNPVVPQVAAAWGTHWLAGSVPPAATAVQVPALPVSAQDMHVDAQVVEQQTPCAQIPVLHSVAVAQAAPVDFSPHDPPRQTAGAAQSALEMQVALQAAAPQA
jgi:hypothetical protein